MRIEFPHAAREDFSWSAPSLRVGSGPDNDLVLAVNQAAPHHLTIHQDGRGLVLEMGAQVARIYVNARPVREKALLRAGDVISIGDCRLLLRDDADPAARIAVDALLSAQGAVSVRAVAGPLSGRSWSLGESLQLGPQGQPPLELPQSDRAMLRIGRQGRSLHLQLVQAAEKHPLRVNGVRVHDTLLWPGDQIGIGTHRFVIDAPAVAAPGKADPPTPVPLPEETAGPSGEVWWLIVTAAVLALGIALALLFHF